MGNDVHAEYASLHNRIGMVLQEMTCCTAR